MNKGTISLLERWLRNTKRSQIANYDAANYYSSINTRLGIPAVILSAIVGTSVFATLQSSIALWIRIVVGIFSVIAAVFSSLQTFLKSDERASKHRSSAAEYGTIKRDIDELLVMHKESEQDFNERISRIRDRMDNLSRVSCNTKSNLE